MKHKYKRFKKYDLYLYFMLCAYGGAFIWQMFLPTLAEKYSVWGVSVG